MSISNFINLTLSIDGYSAPKVTFSAKPELLVSDKEFNERLSHEIPFDNDHPELPDMRIIFSVIAISPIRYLIPYSSHNKRMLKYLSDVLNDELRRKNAYDILYPRNSITSFKFVEESMFHTFILAKEMNLFAESSPQTYLVICDKLKPVVGIQTTRLMLSSRLHSDDKYSVIFYKPRTAYPGWTNYKDGKLVYNSSVTGITNKNLDIDTTLVNDNIPSATHEELTNVINKKEKHALVYLSFSIFGFCAGKPDCSVKDNIIGFEQVIIQDSMCLLPYLLDKLQPNGTYIHHGKRMNLKLSMDYLQLLKDLFNTVEVFISNREVHFGTYTIVCKGYKSPDLKRYFAISESIVKSKVPVSRLSSDNTPLDISRKLHEAQIHVADSATIFFQSVFNSDENTDARIALLQALNASCLRSSIDLATKYGLEVKPQDLYADTDNQKKLALDYKTLDSYFESKIKSHDKFVAKYTKYTDDEVVNNERLVGFGKLESLINLYRTNIEMLNFKRYNRINYTVRIHGELGHNVQAKLKLDKKPSNAWLKLFELMVECDLKGRWEGKTINRFHVAEAPGNFVLAADEYFKRSNIKSDWLANSLNPHNKYNQKLYDQFIFGDEYGLLSGNRQKWLFGDNNGTGDLTDPNVIRQISAKAKEMLPNILFMTGDAGLSMDSGIYNRQEDELAKINLGQCLVALKTLSKGGFFIYKTFLPLRLPSSLSTLWLMRNVFDQLLITKPINSRPANAEIYVVCKNFIGIDNKLLDSVIDMLPTFKANDSICDLNDISQNFLDEVLTAVDKLVLRMCNQLQRIFLYYDSPATFTKEFMDEFAKLKKESVKVWFQKYIKD